MTASEELKKFCAERNITISLIEDAPKADKDSIITIPSIKIKVSYKKDATNTR